MKLNTDFVRFLLLFEKHQELPEGSEAFEGFKKVWDEYDGGDEERFAIGAMLIAHSELDEDDVAGLTEAVLVALKYKEEFSAENWAINEAFAGAIQKLNCAEGAFKVMTEATDDPMAEFTDLLDELEELKVTLPTEEEWTALNPKKEYPEPTPKKTGGKKKKLGK